jgi:hypothetical protein
MRGMRAVENGVDLELRDALLQIFEQATAAAKEHGCESNFQFFDNAHIQVLLDHIRSAGDANITISSSFTGKLKSALGARAFRG